MKANPYNIDGKLFCQIQGPTFLYTIFIDREAREIMYVASVHPSVFVCVSVCLSSPAVKFGVKSGHYQSGGFVCLSVIRGHVPIILRIISRLLIEEESYMTL